MNEFVNLSRKYPPKCLNGFRVAIVEECFGGYTSEFKLSCSCGSDLFELIGESETQLGMEPVISSVCTKCKNQKHIVDVNEFGYDAEYGHGTSYPEMELGDEKYLCDCGKSEFRISMKFTYQFESLDEFEDVEANKIPNYFDVVGISAECKCGAVNFIGDFDCT